MTVSTLPNFLCFPLLLLAFLACSSEDIEPSEELSGGTDPIENSCIAHSLESDAELAEALGESGDPANWPALPPNAVVASTYLRLQDTQESKEAFDELVGPIQGVLMAPDSGLMGLSFSSSASCNTTRTLTVWESEEAMISFVVSDAHALAIARVGEVSRGGSLTETWKVADFDNLGWQDVAKKFKNHTGRAY